MFLDPQHGDQGILSALGLMDRTGDIRKTKNISIYYMGK